MLQLAVEHADDSPVTKGTEKYLEDNKVDWVWLRREQRVEHASINPCLTVLEGHTDKVVGAQELTDGRILSWSWDNTLRIWDRDGSCLTVLEGHTDKVVGAQELTDGRILSWSWDNTLRIWDRDGSCLTVLEGHTDKVVGAQELTDGRILSWSWDNTLRIWDRDGLPLNVLEGHTDEVLGSRELTDGHILSWFSRDKTLRVWDRDGTPLTVLVGHTFGVVGARELIDGRILSWSSDNTLRIWCRDGSPLALLQGHTGRVSGAKELTDGSILSWSNDKTFRIWNSITGACAETLNLNQFCLKYPKSILRYPLEDLYYPSLYAISEWRSGEIKIPIRKEEIILCARWDSNSDLASHLLRTDGSLILTQANGQVCFLRLYQGNKRIMLDELFSYFRMQRLQAQPESSEWKDATSTHTAKKDYEQILREGLKYHRSHYGSFIDGHLGHLCALITLLEKEIRIDEIKEIMAERYEVAKLCSLRTKSLDLTRLRQQAMIFFAEGKYMRAEQNLRKILYVDFQVPNTLCYLIRVLIIQDRLDVARLEVQQAWKLRSEAPTFVIPRILWFQTAFALLDDVSPTPYIANFKTSLEADDAFTNWAMQPVLDHLKPKLSAEAHALLTALVTALSYKDKVTELDAFQVWRETKPLQLE